MKLYLQILELNLKHKFKESFVTFWNNQNGTIYKLDKENPTCNIEWNINPKLTVGLMLGAYGVRHIGKEKIYHPCGSVLIDLSKIKTQKSTNILTDLLDSTFVKPNMGKIHFLISWTSNTIPPHIPNMQQIGETMYNASEKNLTYIAPWGQYGVPPIDEQLVRLHSPYYTCNIGVTMPSGAFLLNLGSKTPLKDTIESHIERLETVLTLYGLKQETFIRYANKIAEGESDIELNNALYVLAKTLTMHSNQVQKYVEDIQYSGKQAIETDRWECPRNIDSNYVGDCEDTAKEIMIEIYEWQRMKSDNKLVEVVQKMLKKFIPLAVQGAVDVNGTLKNHIWAALVPENVFSYALDKTSKQNKYTLPTILLEGTADTTPLKCTPECIQSTSEMSRKIINEEPILQHATFRDVQPSGWYKYVVAAMTPLLKDRGIIDYVYTSRNKYGESKYGIPFEKWLSGKYIMTPATKHTRQNIKTMEMLCSYDKPIVPLQYKTNIFESIGKPVYNMNEKQIKLGYKLFSLDDSTHLKICKAMDRLKEKKWKIFGNVINHEKSFWVEWVVEYENKKKNDFEFFLL